MTCVNCKFYVAPVPVDNPRPGIAALGTCHFNPPTVITRGQTFPSNSDWPTVQETDLCGQYVAAS